MIPFSFLENPIAKYATIALVVVLLCGGFYIKGRGDGRSLVEAAVASEKAKWEIRVAEQQRDTDVAIAKITFEYNQKTTKYQAEVDKLKKKSIVKVYVPKKVDKPVPKGVIDLVNTASAGTPLIDTPKPDAAQSSDKTLSDLGISVATNYYMCNKYIDQLTTLQDVVKQFQLKQKELTK